MPNHTALSPENDDSQYDPDERLNAMSQKEMKSFIGSLKDSEIIQVMNRLLERSPGLPEKAYGIAVAITDGVDESAIMDDVYHALNALDVDDLYSRSGRTRYGYAEPHEVSWEMFEEAITPFIDEMKKCQKRNQPGAAKTHCIGIIKGLWRFDEDSCSDFKDWVQDAPYEFVSTAFDEWKKGIPSDDDIADVLRIIQDNSV